MDKSVSEWARNQSDRSVLDFMKTIWNDAIVERIASEISEIN